MDLFSVVDACRLASTGASACALLTYRLNACFSQGCNYGSAIGKFKMILDFSNRYLLFVKLLTPDF
jgi:hypothetical protein